MTATTEPKPRRIRLTRDDRMRHFLQEAIGFFAEVGFSGDTKALARRLNVGQPLLYRYFPSKEALIERVFQETFLANWNPLWEEMLTDRAVDLPTRLASFHQDFAQVHLQRDRIRLSLFFALHGWDMGVYFKLMRDRVYVPIAAGLRDYAGAPGIADEPLRAPEVEYAKMVIEKIQYYGIRKWVYGVSDLPPIEPLIDISLSGLLGGAREAIPRFLGVGALYRHGQTTYQHWVREMADASGGRGQDAA